MHPTGRDGSDGAADRGPGARLLAGADVAGAREQITREVQQHVSAALHGPIGTALAAGNPAPGGDTSVGSGGTDGQSAGSHIEDPAALLGAALPRTFIATGAAITTGYAALAAGDEVRVAGALLCAQRLLFRDDPVGSIAFSAAARAALQSTDESDGDGDGDARSLDAAAAMQRRVERLGVALDTAFSRGASHLHAAALSSYSWKRLTGGAGPGSDVLSGHLAPFLLGLVRWAFLVEAALDGIRKDDWARAGAALVAARRVTAGA